LEIFLTILAAIVASSASITYYRPWVTFTGHGFPVLDAGRGEWGEEGEQLQRKPVRRKHGVA